MGDPKKQKKKYNSPRFPWRSDVLQNELRLIGQYGLRNKRELWKYETKLSKFRGIARSILSLSQIKRAKIEKEFLAKLVKRGILPENAKLDNVLDLTTNDILQRRLQTIIFQKGLAKTIYQSRQLITHGHISIDGNKVFSPSYIVSRDEEGTIDFSINSPLANQKHPLREFQKPNNGENINE